MIYMIEIRWYQLKKSLSNIV
uniref:Uncharacterized protein n=1 Tax=Arundo donax TaxID=35708 RepID=A0A0A8ZEZ8_ARUDO